MGWGIFQPVGDSGDDNGISDPPDAGSSAEEYKGWLARDAAKQSKWRNDPKNKAAVQRAKQTRDEGKKGRGK